MKPSIVIIGGGPAGLMTAYQLSKNNIHFTLIDKNPILGKKLLITGSSRCNVTNNKDNKDFINDLTIKHKKFLYSTIQRFGSKEVISFFENQNVPLVLENNLKYFPVSNKSVDILNVLRRNLNGTILLNTQVVSVEKKEKYEIKTDNDLLKADILIIATGSRSFPQTGSTGDGLKFAKKLKHEVTNFYPAETSLYSDFISQNTDYLQGVSILNSTVSIEGTKHRYTGPLLFTHFGLSGPVINHISEFMYFSLLEGKDKVTLSLTDKSENEINSILKNESNKDTFVVKLLDMVTVKRVSRFILEYLNIKNKKLSETSKKDVNRIINTLLRFSVIIQKVEALEKAYVNGGGVITKELNPKSFESKIHDNLYFIGETVDIHGPIGGYNITLAFSSGFSAAQDIIDKCNRGN